MNKISPFPSNEDNIRRLAHREIQAGNYDEAEEKLLHALRQAYHKDLFLDLVSLYDVRHKKDEMLAAYQIIQDYGIDHLDDPDLAMFYADLVYQTQEPLSILQTLTIERQAQRSKGYDTSYIDVLIEEVEAAHYFKHQVQLALQRDAWQKLDEAVINLSLGELENYLKYLEDLSIQEQHRLYAWLARTEALDAISRGKIIQEQGFFTEPVPYRLYNNQWIELTPEIMQSDSHEEFTKEVAQAIEDYVTNNNPHFEDFLLITLFFHSQLFYPKFTGELFTAEEWLKGILVMTHLENYQVSSKTLQLLEEAQEIQELFIHKNEKASGIS